MRKIAMALGAAFAFSGTTAPSQAMHGAASSAAQADAAAVQGPSNPVMATNNGVVPKGHPMHHFYKHKYRTPNSSGGRKRR
jgi:hypothetical protein